MPINALPNIAPSSRGLDMVGIGALIARNPEQAAMILAQMGVGPNEFQQQVGQTIYERDMGPAAPGVFGVTGGGAVPPPVAPPSGAPSLTLQGLNRPPNLPWEQGTSWTGQQPPLLTPQPSIARPPDETIYPSIGVPYVQQGGKPMGQGGIGSDHVTSKVSVPVTPPGPTTSERLVAVLEALRGVKAPPTPEPQRVATPSPPSSRAVQGGNVIAALQALVGSQPQQRVAPIQLIDALRVR